ncbi:hypothetical protein D3C73_1218330 [compost metagenome]
MWLWRSPFLAFSSLNSCLMYQLLSRLLSLLVWDIWSEYSSGAFLRDCIFAEARFCFCTCTCTCTLARAGSCVRLSVSVGTLKIFPSLLMTLFSGSPWWSKYIVFSVDVRCCDSVVFTDLGLTFIRGIFGIGRSSESLLRNECQACPVRSIRFLGSPPQYPYAFNPPSPNGLQLSGLLNRINTGLNCRYPLPK